MYRVEMKLIFDTKTKEQAEYLTKFFDDAQSLMICENSSFFATGIELIPTLEEDGAYVLEEISIELQKDAEHVLERMNELRDKEGFVTVADYMTLLGLDSNYLDVRYGWRSLKGVDVREARRGWKLHLPKPQPVD